MFFTKVTLPDSKLEIDFESKIITIGSCFSDNIGRKLENAFFDIITNPFGVLYNPISVKNGLKLMLNKNLFSEKDIFYHNEQWHSFSHSSHYSHTNKQSCLENLNSKLDKTREFIKKADFLFITFGTAWVFENRTNGAIVSNCHKLPAPTFNRYKLSTAEIVKEYADLLEKISKHLPQLQIIFTVSPIRHWKDGANENTLSKSTLHLAINELQQQFDNTHYFPAYEIVMDELRDYRFYDSDMIHPNQVAIDYIWQRFAEQYFSTTTNSLKNDLEKFRKMTQHKPISTKSKSYQKFTQTIELKKEHFITKYLFLKERF